jgi:hypothetical protein
MCTVDCSGLGNCPSGACCMATTCNITPIPNMCP